MYFEVYYKYFDGMATTEVDKFSADSHIFKEGIVVFFNHIEEEAIPTKAYPISGLVKIEMLTSEECEILNKIGKGYFNDSTDDSAKLS